MKILHSVGLYYPKKGGAQEAIRQISERLVSYGHDVTIVTTKLPQRDFQLDRGIKIKEFDIKGTSLKGYSGEIEQYQDFLINSDFEIIMNFSSDVWCTDLMFPIFDKIRAKKVFTPCGFFQLNLPGYQNYFAKMKSIVQKYDMCIVMSESYRDTQFIQENNGKFIVIPNGADEREFDRNIGIDIRERLEIPKDGFLILLVGNHTGHKGHAEAIKIFKKASIKNCTLLIVAGEVYGHVLGPLCKVNCNLQMWLNSHLKRYKKSNKTILVRKLTREETVAAYMAADIFLFPSRIECSPIVLFECLASRTPFLTTDVGNSKEIISWTHAGELLPTRFQKNGFCKAVIPGSVEKLEQMFSDPEKRKKYAENGYRAYKERFTWEKVARIHEELYKELLK